MNLKEFNSLTDLFFYQAEKQNPKSIFLEWLNPKNKKIFTWSETNRSVSLIRQSPDIRKRRRKH